MSKSFAGSTRDSIAASPNRTSRKKLEQVKSNHSIVRGSSKGPSNKKKILKKSIALNANLLS
jgi:hypothetical protein